MEFYVPIRGKDFTETKWVHTYSSRNESDGVIYKNATVETDYFKTVNIEPWNEDKNHV